MSVNGRVLRSKSHQRGATTSGEDTSTWSKGASGEQNTNRSTQPPPQPSASVKSAPGTVVSASRRERDIQGNVDKARETHERVESNRDRNSVINRELDDRNQDSRLSVLKAELEVRKAELELAEKHAATAKCRLELARIEARSSSGGAASVFDEEHRVRNWVEQQSQRPPAIEENRVDPPRPDKQRRRPQINEFAIDARQQYAPIIHRATPELPSFDGNITEWIAFRAEFEDTAPMFSAVNNVSRIRKALKGEARVAVKSIMYTVRDPFEIMEALERYFGDPEEIVLTEIHNVKRMPRLAEDNSNMVSFASHIANAVATIRALNQDRYLFAPELVNKIVDKLNILVRYEWLKYRKLHTGMPDLVAISTFLNEISSAAKRTSRYKPIKSRAVNAVSYENRKGGVAAMARPPTYRRDESTGSESEREERPRTVAQIKVREHKKPPPEPRTPLVQNATRPKCVICSSGNEHKIDACSKFLSATINERWEMAKGARICYRCLEMSHRRPIKCKYVPCGVNQCEAGHHKLLHGLTTPSAPVSCVNINSVNSIRRAGTFLKIIPIELSGPLGTVRTHALLDEGSAISLVEHEIADQIAPREKGQPLAIGGIGGHVVNDNDSCRIRVAVRGCHSKTIEMIDVYTINKLNITTQEVPREIVEQCDHLREIIDELCYEEATPTILIGQDNWHLIVSRQILAGKRSLPVASLTNLGWVLHGQYFSPRPVLAVVNHVRPATTEDEMFALMKKHFSIESLGVENKRPKDDPDRRALQVLNHTCEKIPGENRYRAGLIWRTDNETLPDNRAHALKRLYSLERKLDRDDNLKQEYTNQVNNLLTKGYAEKVDSPPPADSPRAWYLPHFPTVHPQKGKLRLVFDAACKAYGKSLNDALLPGPDLLESLFGVLVRFREGKIAVIADVKEMFLQIEIIPQDRDSLRFVWRGGDRLSPPQEYRMKRLIFGSAASPTTALYVKNKNAKSQANEFPIAAEKTIKNTYMDDMLVAFDQDEAQVRKIVNEIYAINLQASFELRGFASNYPAVLKDVTSTKQDASPIGECDNERTLGLKWNHRSDTLGFNVNLRNTPPDVLNGVRLPTKREITSSAMSIFDPVGYASPISVLGKVLMQLTWKEGIAWDTTIPESLRPAWLSFINNIQQLKELEIPRYVFSLKREVDLHIFCDASEQIYAAAVYMVSQDEKGVSHSSLVAAKARVAPLKVISVPRLELQGCVLGTRLAESIIKESDYIIKEKYYWTDSKTVLAWIRASPRSYKSFVAHRLAEIEDVTTPLQWNWVPSLLNVADDATKGVPAQFGPNHRWFVGPDFIKKGREEWPKEKVTEPAAPTGEERTQQPVCSVQVAQLKFDFLPETRRFSKFSRLVRATARVLVAAEAFKAKLLSRKQEMVINNDHMKLAEALLIKRSQYESYLDEIKHLEAGRALPKKSPLHKIAVKLDSNGIIVLDARVDRDQTRIPVLHAKESFVKLLIHHFHTLFNHGNHATVINELKQRYFIVSLRGSIRYLSNKCQWCRTYKGPTLRVPEGDLPTERLQANQPPFTATGVDLFGPINITIGRRHEKRWGVLYTCLTTRAVHLELAASLSASSMILSLRRMISRRGTPTVIYSDNATNFCGAERELSEALNTLPNAMEPFTSARNILWKKIPPGNPSAGGAWERLVGSVKTALKTTLKDSSPHEEVLHTLLLEAEHIINSRPLTPVNPDLEQEALTPNHFLIGRSNAMSPLGSFTDTKLSLSSWKTTQALAEQFWKRWISEYRPSLLPRSSSHLQTRKLQLNDIVIIADNTMPRGTWPRGIIAKLYPGKDGHVRVADVQTRAGLLRRPASRLVFICSSNDGADARGGECRI